jgi:hypothetical protein
MSVRKKLIQNTLVLVSVLVCADAAYLSGANMRNFIESVRRRALVVYVGSVKEVRFLKRTKFDINAKAIVAIKAVMRTAGTSPSQATIECSSFDEKTPMLEGGPQYQLRPGATLIIFANSFEASIPPGYLLQGSREELLQRIEVLRDALREMSADQLQVNEITEQDRDVQLRLYERLAAYLRAVK